MYCTRGEKKATFSARLSLVQDGPGSSGMTENTLLTPNHHPNGDLFVLENLPRVVSKSDMPSMADPYFALTVGDTTSATM